jgi:hypothetical protein
MLMQIASIAILMAGDLIGLVMVRKSRSIR